MVERGPGLGDNSVETVEDAPVAEIQHTPVTLSTEPEPINTAPDVTPGHSQPEQVAASLPTELDIAKVETVAKGGPSGKPEELEALMDGVFNFNSEQKDAA